jgi:DNA-binding response OmpR family regulator
MDHRMPGGGGLALLAQVELLPTRPSIIVVSASPEAPSAYPLGSVAAFVEKPFEIDDLLARIKHTLEPAAP